MENGEILAKLSRMFAKIGQYRENMEVQKSRPI